MTLEWIGDGTLMNIFLNNIDNWQKRYFFLWRKIALNRSDDDTECTWKFLVTDDGNNSW